MSTIEVNKITPVSGGSTVQVGESGDTINIPAGATIANAGTATGFGVSLANGADNRVVTASSDSALNGESTLTYNGSNLGVNTASPTMIAGTGMHLTSSGSDCRLHISNNTVGDTANDGAYMFMGSDGTLGLLNMENAPMRFFTNGTEQARIDSSGRVGIGLTPSTSANAGKLQITGDSSDYLIRLRANNNTHADVKMISYTNLSGTSIGYVMSNNNNTISYLNSSDYRLKENVDYNWDATTRLKKLKPARFNWISDETNTVVDGFIAHEVSDIVPEAIGGKKDATETYTDDNGEEKTRISPQGIDQGKLVPLLTKALQEAITKIETLEARVKTLEDA